MPQSRLPACLLVVSLLSGCAWTSVREGAAQDIPSSHESFHRVLVVAEATSPTLGHELEQAFADRLLLAGAYAIPGDRDTLAAGSAGYHKLALAHFDAVLLLRPTTDLKSESPRAGLNIELRSTADGQTVWKSSAETTRWVQAAPTDDEATTARSQADALVRQMSSAGVISFRLQSLTK